MPPDKDLSELVTKYNLKYTSDEIVQKVSPDVIDVLLDLDYQINIYESRIDKLYKDISLLMANIDKLISHKEELIRRIHRNLGFSMDESMF